MEKDMGVEFFIMLMGVNMKENGLIILKKVTLYIQMKMELSYKVIYYE